MAIPPLHSLHSVPASCHPGPGFTFRKLASPFRAVLATGAVLAGAQALHGQVPETTPPALVAAPLQDGRLQLSWPNAGDRWRLEGAPELGVSTRWSPVLPLPPAENGVVRIRLAPEHLAGYFRLRLLPPALTRLESSSPADGESGVAVTREMILRLSAPLAESAVVGNEQLNAWSNGRRLLTRIAVSTDRTTLTLFYLEPVPGGSRVQVNLDGDRLKDVGGQPLDADGDGVAGGLGILEYDTMNPSPVAGTAIRGRVYASELVAGPDTVTSATNRPLAGVIITVDGREESQRTTTDALGNFVLTNCPAGRFFVHVDGHTAQGSQWPGGAYYPVVGKAWETVAGRGDNLAGGSGEIFLPLIRAGTLQPVSSTRDTVVTFPEEVVRDNPALAGVSITVPANSLVGDDGLRGGRVGIAPVPPDRLPEPLPPGLEMPLVITVQTDGPLNFDRPAPACFPNLPDPVTKVLPAPGSRQWLMSFNHDKGHWEGVGSMTVSADGRYVCTDAGVGIRQPGWHGVAPRPAVPFPNHASCPRGWVAIVSTNNPGGYECLEPIDAVPDCRAAYDNCYDAAEAFTLKCVGGSAAVALGCLPMIISSGPVGAVTCIPGIMGIGICLPLSQDRFAKCEQQYQKCLASPASAAAAGRDGAARADEAGGLPSVGDPVADEVISKVYAAANVLAPYANSKEPLPDNVRAQLQALYDAANAAAGGDAAGYLTSLITRREQPASTRVEQSGNAPDYPVLYAAEIERPGGILMQIRGRTTAHAQYQVFMPRDGVLRTVRFFDPRTGNYGQVFPYQRTDAFFQLPAAELYPPSPSLSDLDLDGDNLADGIELVLGTGPTNRDSDNDGLTDGAEVAAGSDPLDGRPSVVGVVASAMAPGNAVDVAAQDGLAILALGTAGLGVLDVSDPSNPVLLSVLDTVGRASAVAFDGSFAVVADGGGGLAVIDLSVPASPRLARTVSVGDAFAVATADGIAYVGAMVGGKGRLVAVHLQTGAVLQVFANLDVEDVFVTGRTLWCLLGTKLESYRIDGRTLVKLGTSPALSYRAETVAGRRRLFVGRDYAYASGFPGVDILDVRDPAAMVITAKPVDRGVANSFKQMVVDAGGIGVAAVGVNPRNDGTHDVYLYDVSKPAVATNQLSVLPTPGLTYAVTLHRGLAFAADGANGLQVLNYRPPDTALNPPQIALDASFSLAPAEAEEGIRAWVAARVVDDVNVRTVEFFIDGVRVAEDGAFPFEHRFVTPALGPAKTAFTIQARATDTGGNSQLSPVVTVKLLPDKTPAVLIGSNPADGSTVNNVVQAVTATFEEALATVPAADAMGMLAPGPDQVFGTADDIEISGSVRLSAPNQLLLDLTGKALANGSYRAIVRTSLKDLAGNPLTGPLVWAFTVNDAVPPLIAATSPWNGETDVPPTLQMLEVRFSEPADAATVGRSALEVRGAGPDGAFDTFDDELATVAGATPSVDGLNWKFTLAESLGPDRYRATVGATVADLAGNRVSGTRDWQFDLPLRTTLRVRMRMPDGTPAVGASIRERNHGASLGAADANGEITLVNVPFAHHAAPDFELARSAGNRRYHAGLRRVPLVPGGVTDLGIVSLEELCDPRLDGHAFAGGEFLDEVRTMVQFDDGTGPALFGAGRVRRAEGTAGDVLVRHDGKTWRRVAAEFTGGFRPQLRALAVFNDGQGPALYVGGYFEQVNGIPAMNIARWNGQRWEGLASGLAEKNGQPWGVYALTVHDDGSGPAIVAGGRFDVTGATPMPNLARWNGSSWSAIGEGLVGFNPFQNTPDARLATVFSLASIEDAGVRALVAGGQFQFPVPGGGGVLATNIARWKQGAWTTLGTGLHGEFGDGVVRSLALFDEGAGPRLFAGGQFSMAGSTPVSSIARWNGTEWSRVGSGEFNGVNGLGVIVDAAGTALVAGGSLVPDPANPSIQYRLARWNGQAWTRLGGAADSTTDGHFLTLAELPPAGSRVWMFGSGGDSFVDADGELAQRGSVVWAAQRWAPAEEAFDGDILALQQWNDGTGPALYLGGTFTSGGGRRVAGLARWDGNSVEAVGGGLHRTENPLRVVSLLAHDDGNGPSLFAAGWFATAGPNSATNLARWDGTHWSAVGGLQQHPVAPIQIRTMAVYNDGTGVSLFIGGSFDRIRDASGLRNGKYLARWDGTTWSVFPQIGNGQGSGLTGIGTLVAVNSGPDAGLYAGGIVSFVDGNKKTLQGFARWDGTSFRSVGDFAAVFPPPSPFVPSLAGGVEGLAWVDSAAGPELYLAGTFYSEGGNVEDPAVVRLRNGHWETLPTLPGGVRFLPSFGGLSPAFAGLTSFDDGFGVQLLVATQVGTSANTSAAQQAVWARWDGASWLVPGPVGEGRITSNLLPLDVNGHPTLIRSGRSGAGSGTGLVRWHRPAGPCP